MGIIYIIQLREFICTDKYKIGRSDSNHLIRVNSYPKGSILLFLLTVNNSTKIEKKIINDFIIKYNHLTDYGNEYFGGCYKSMIYDIIDISKAIDDNVEHQRPVIRDAPPTEPRLPVEIKWLVNS